MREVELVVAPKRNASRTLVANGQPLHDANGRLLGAVATMHDITERKRVEEQLKATPGRELAELLRAEKQDLKAIFLSGYGAEELAKFGGTGDLPRNRFLPKPCSPQVLAQAVRSTLDEHSSETR